MLSGTISLERSVVFGRNLLKMSVSCNKNFLKSKIIRIVYYYYSTVGSNLGGFDFVFI